MAAGDARVAAIAAQRSASAARAAARRNAADVGNALAAHYSPTNTDSPVDHYHGKTLPTQPPPAPPTGGGRQRVYAPKRQPVFRDPVARLAPFSTPPTHVAPRMSRVDMSALAAQARYEGTPSMDQRRTFVAPGDVHGLERAHRDLARTSQETVLQVGAYAAGLLHNGQVDPAAAARIHYRDGKVVITGTPAQRRESAGLLSLAGTGNALQKAGEDLLGIPVGAAAVAMNPSKEGPALAKGMLNYYEQNPLKNLRQDPFMFGLNYVLPAVSLAGGAVGRAGEVGNAASAFGTDASLADIARYRSSAELQQALAGETPRGSSLAKSRAVAKAAIKTPPAPVREFGFGDQSVVLPGSRNHAVNLFHKAVTDRLINHALDGGVDLFGMRGKLGRTVRANLRVQGAVRNAELSRLSKVTKGLSAAQEHAVFILAKGHTAESYARYLDHALLKAQASGDEQAAASGDEQAATFFENQLHLTKISAKYLEPGAEDPAVLKAADVMRSMISSREHFYGSSEDQINHALGSHFYGIHTRAEGLPSLHAELEQIHAEHGAYAESPRHFLDQHIASLERFKAQSGAAHAAELQAEIDHLHTLQSDVQLAQHRIGQVDQQLREMERRPRTDAEARARLAELEQKHAAFEKQIHDTLFTEKLTPDELAEQRFRNQENGRAKRQESGKTKSGRASGASGRKSVKRPLVREDRQKAVEAEIQRAIERLPDHPSTKQFLAERDELHHLRSELEPRVEEAFGGEKQPRDFGTGSAVVDHPDRFIQHPENLAASHRALLIERSRLEDHLNTVVAHDRTREIHASFEQKGAELRGVPADAGTGPVLAAERADGRQAPSLDHAQVASLERHYGADGGNWTPEQTKQFHSDMAAAARGEHVPSVVQSVFNASLVAPPEAFYLPFESELKASKRGTGQIAKTESTFGFGPPQQEARHEFTGAILDDGGFRTKSSHLARSAYSKAAHWQNMQDLHAMLWALSKDTSEEAGGGRFGGDPVPIRDIRQIPESLRKEVYGVYPGDVLEGEAPDRVAQQLMEHWTAPPKHGEHVRWVNRDYVRPLEPQRAGAVLRFVNNLNNAFRFGRFLNPGYLRWLPQNLVLNLFQQGPMILRNAHSLWREIDKLDPVVYHQIAESVSFGPARALETETVAGKVNAFQHRVAHAWAHLNDHIPRMLSFVQEASAAGFKTAEDWKALMTDPRLEGQRNAIIMRANKESIDYGAMSPRERIYMKSIFAYWPWVRAASLWALRFPFEHPYQMVVYSQLGQEGKKVVDAAYAKKGGIAPAYERAAYPAKSGPVPLGWLTAFEQLGQDADFLAGLTKSHPELSTEGMSAISPVAKPLMELISGRDQFGNAPRAGVLADAANRMAKTFEPYSVFRTAGAKQTGSTPKGPAAAILQWLGGWQERGFDYSTAAKNALKDASNETRARFMLKEDPNAKTVPHAELQLVIRVAQIKDGTSSKGTDRVRKLELADAAYQGTSLSDLNSLMVSNHLKPFSPGDLNAERSRLRSISP